MLREHFAENATLQRIRAGKAVRDEELEELARLVLQVDDKANVKHLAATTRRRGVRCSTCFRASLGSTPRRSSRRSRRSCTSTRGSRRSSSGSYRCSQNHIAQNGGIELERLYEPPFTTLHAESVDGVFTRYGEVDEILAILSAFQPQGASRPPPRASEPHDHRTTS